MRLRLMSDVPLGMFLSGGLDSSAIAAIMARMIDRPLQTFSVAFKERAFSELTWAREVAQAVGADAHEVVIGAEQFFDALPRLVWHEDEPIAHPSSVPLYFVSALAREHVTVVLTGEGSDELLAGYGKYPACPAELARGRGLRARDARTLARRWIAERVIPALPGRAARYARRSFLAVEHTPEAAFFDNFAAVPLARQRELFDGRLRARRHARGRLQQLARAGSIGRGDRPLLDRHALRRHQDVPGRAADEAGPDEHGGVDREPRALPRSQAGRVRRDHAGGVEALRLHDEARARARRRKTCCPHSILRRPKMGFPVPFGIWSRGPWHGVVRDVLLDRRARERGLFDAAQVTRLLDDHAAGPHRGRRRPVEPPQSRALVPHLD